MSPVTTGAIAASHAIAAAGLDQLSSGRPHPLAAGPFWGGQPAAIGILHGSGIARCAGRHQSQ
jgi:hypothetical protein